MEAGVGLRYGNFPSIRERARELQSGVRGKVFPGRRQSKKGCCGKGKAPSAYSGKCRSCRFHEAAVSAEQRQTLQRKFTRQGVQYDVDTLAAGDFHNLVGKSERARIHDVLHAQRFEVVALFGRASGGENFRSVFLRDCTAAKPTPPAAA